MSTSHIEALLNEVRTCRVCAEALAAGPRPVVQFSSRSRLVIIGQAPGSRVHQSGIPWDDRSGARLREWTGLGEREFYDAAKVALVPMGFCYPGAGQSGDLPPRPECAPRWHDRILESLPAKRLILLVGSFAQARYLPQARKQTLTETVRHFAQHGPMFFPLPHPSWRSGIWMQRNPWFEAEILPVLRATVRKALSGGNKQ
jgi:uracil-DNA glycosylase